MTRAEMLAELQDVLNTSSSGGAWRESVLLAYLAEGQDIFCERTGYFRDKTAYTVTLVADQASYDLNDRIIQVLSVWNGTTRLGHFQEEDKFAVDEMLSAQTFPASGQTPHLWQTDQETGQLTLYPTPTSEDAGTTLTLRVWRYAQTDLATAEAEPEIPSALHRACVEWAAYKAFNHHDMEAQDPVKAVDHLDAFEMYVRRGKALFRKRHAEVTRAAPNPVYAT